MALFKVIAKNLTKHAKIQANCGNWKRSDFDWKQLKLCCQSNCIFKRTLLCLSLVPHTMDLFRKQGVQKKSHLGQIFCSFSEAYPRLLQQCCCSWNRHSLQPPDLNSKESLWWNQATEAGQVRAEEKPIKSCLLLTSSWALDSCSQDVLLTFHANLSYLTLLLLPLVGFLCTKTKRSLITINAAQMLLLAKLVFSICCWVLRKLCQDELKYYRPNFHTATKLHLAEIFKVAELSSCMAKTFS